MGESKSTISKIFSTILKIVMGIGLFILYGIINSLSEINGGIEIGMVIVFLIVLGYIYMFLIALLTKESIIDETKDYGQRKWYKKSKVWVSTLFVLIGIISFLSVPTDWFSIIITIVLISLALLTLVIPRITIPILVLYLLADIFFSFTSGSISILIAIGSVLTKGAYILLSIRVFLVANKLREGKNEKITSKNIEKKTLRELYSTSTKEEYSYQPKSGINKIIIWSLSVSLFILIWIGVFSLLGFRINKDYFTYDENVCIADNWIGNKYHDGIDDCVYWARYNDLVKGRNLEEEWNQNKESLINCPEDCGIPNLNEYNEWMKRRGVEIECDLDPDFICDYSDYVDYVHHSNKDYLKSMNPDSFLIQCVQEICKRPSFVTVE